jgi:hypothetical protein
MARELALECQNDWAELSDPLARFHKVKAPGRDFWELLIELSYNLLPRAKKRKKGQTPFP